MSKEPSKLERQRAMGEAKFMRRTERGRPIPEPEKPAKTELQHTVDEIVAPKPPTPNLKPAKPPRNVATKQKKVAAEAIGRTRAGKRQLSVWVGADLDREMRVCVAQEGMKIEAWIERVLREYLDRGHGGNK